MPAVLAFSPLAICCWPKRIASRRSHRQRFDPVPKRGLPSVSWPTETEYFCTHSAHDPETLTHHMNSMARAGWDLLTVDFAIRGETGFHTFFWRRRVSVSA